MWGEILPSIKAMGFLACMGEGLLAGILLFRPPVREAVVFSFTCQLSAMRIFAKSNF